MYIDGYTKEFVRVLNFGGASGIQGDIKNLRDIVRAQERTKLVAGEGSTIIRLADSATFTPNREKVFEVINHLIGSRAQAGETNNKTSKSVHDSQYVIVTSTQAGGGSNSHVVKLNIFKRMTADIV